MKTIICSPQEFDKEYSKWKNSFSDGIKLTVIDIKHDGDNHYIQFNWKIK